LQSLQRSFAKPISNAVLGTIELEDDFVFTILNYGMILVSKFLEIWNEFGSLSKTNSRIVEVRRAIQPLIDRIEIWDGLREYRNSTLAHSYRTPQGQLMLPWHLLEAGRAPSYHAEMMALVTAAISAGFGILASFEEEYLAIRPLLASTIENLPIGPGISAGPEIAQSLRPIAVRVGSDLEKLGVRQDNAVYREAHKGRPQDPIMIAMRPNKTTR